MHIAYAGLGWSAVQRFLHTRDPVERALMLKIADRVIRENEKRDESRASKIANAVWGAIKG